MILTTDGKLADFAPQVLGERNPLITNSYWYADTGVQLSGRWQEYAALYRCQPVVATVVDKIANSASRLDMKVYKLDSFGQRTEVPTSPFAKLLADPSRTLAPFQFYRWTFATFETFGEAFWLKIRDNSGAVTAVEPMHPERVSIFRAEDGAIEYVFTTGPASAGIIRVPESEVVAFQRYNPDNTMRGLSRLEQLRVTLANEDAARRASAAFWKNGARPSVVITHPGELSQNAMDRIKANFDARHSSVDNFGGSVVLEEGMTITETQLNAEEMQYIESRKLNMQEVCMVFDVPPPVVHILDHATYSNITEQMRSMYRDTMAPRLEEFESVLMWSLGVEFYPNGGYIAEFDMTDVLRGDWETRAQWASALRTGGVVTGNEARDIVGMEKSAIALMDKVFANSAVQELGAPRSAVTEKVDAPVGTTMTEATAAGDDGTVPGDELLAPKNPPPGVVPTTPPATPPKPVIGAKPTPTPAQQKAARDIHGAVSRKVAQTADPAHLRQLLVDEHTKALKPYFEEQRRAVLRELESDPKV